MHFDYLALAIPFFLFFIGWEYWYTRKKGKNFYQYAESVADLNVGIAERLTDVFVTPTHHGVHHASNPEYLDKNYGDMLIIWDKLFDIFAEARKEVKTVYGLTAPLKSHSFLWQHFHFWLELYMNFRYARGVKAKLKVLFDRPDDLDPRFRPVLERKFLNVQPLRSPTSAMRQYVTAQTVFSISLLFILTLFNITCRGFNY